MTKAESETAIRHLVHVWAKLHGVEIGQTEQPSFSDFLSWLGEKGYSHYLKFHSVAGPEEDAERWFDEELKQTWRN